MALFKSGDFLLSSGFRSKWKLDLSTLSEDDWVNLAVIAKEILPPFGRVESVPTGGDILTAYLREMTDHGHDDLLIVEDVITTGESMERIRRGRNAIGLAVFSRGNGLPWVYNLFNANIALRYA